jgi:ABC-type uncharacterized transport system substrate-binding protein
MKLEKRHLPLFLFVFTLFIPCTLFAHPHMFIDSKTTLEFDEAGMKGFWVEWLFDQFFTAQILLDYDRNMDKNFSADEISAIEAGAFSNLANYHYFISVTTGEAQVDIKKVSDFRAFMKDDRLGYTFFVPMAIPINNEKKSVQFRISIFDDTFFCDIAWMEKDSVIVRAPGVFSVDWKILRNKNAPIIYDPTGGMARRNGVDYSGTVYPEELYIEVSK